MEQLQSQRRKKLCLMPPPDHGLGLSAGLPLDPERGAFEMLSASRPSASTASSFPHDSDQQAKNSRRASVDVSFGRNVPDTM
jgi:hypothetical protein